jgi:uncharacterized protein YndB with AHSA1/START domain
MAGVVVSVVIPASRQEVWNELARLESHVEWMADADAVEFLSDISAGAGTRMRVATSFGPLRTSDLMEVTEWEPPTRMAVEHQGLFTGTGEFVLEPAGEDRCTVAWREDIRFPWFFGGPVGAWAARPVFRWVWRRNLRRLRDRISAR